jgi:myo-inositol 2-dehydrogenase / D-chiro-inositol 1-dehydrogenase
MTLGGRAKVGVGVIGLGTIGRVHATNLAVGVPRARLVEVADSDERTAREAGEELGVDWSSSVDRLLASRAIDALVIATPPRSHAALIHAAAHAGKAIFCEKPFAADPHSARAAVDAARQAGTILQVGFQRRFDPDFADARRRLESGELGRTRLYFSSMRSEAPPSLRALESGEHRLLFDAACHELDAARWLIGEVEELTVLGGAQPLASAILTLRFTDGTLGSIDLTYVSGYGFDCRCEVVAERASLRVGSPPAAGPEILAAGLASRGVARTFLDRFREAYRLELAGFLDALDAGRPPPVTGEDGVAAQILCAAAERSYAERRPVRVTAEAVREPRALPCSG